MLLVSGLIISCTMLALHPSSAAVITLLGVSVVLLTFVVVTSWVPWSKLPTRTMLAFPLAVMAGVVAIAIADRPTAIAYTGLIVFCFVYVGLTQPPGTSMLMTPAAAGCWLEVQGTWSAVLAVRLIIAISIWVTVGELLGRTTERQTEITRHLRGDANTDPLTGLLNRRGLRERLATATADDTLVLCDLDHFKDVNDRFGHQEGDRVLAAFGALLRQSLRGHDIASRYGGEEFLLLLVGATPEATLEAVGRMRARWTVTYPEITFSAGVAAVDVNHPMQASIAGADTALYDAKAAGRNCDRIFSADVLTVSAVRPPART